MRVATWNVNGIRARLDFVLHWLESRSPDVVLLQELKTADEEFPGEALAKAGYHAHILGQKSWNGVGVLTREPGRVLERGLPGQDGRGARLLTVELRGMSFTSVYVPNGKTIDHEDFAMKLDWLDALVDHLGSAPDRREAIVGGDFNLCPRGIDSYDGERLEGSIFHTREERSRFERLLALGWVDLFRARHPDARLFSWWDYRMGAFHKGMGLRIDFLMASPALADRTRTVTIDREYRKKKDGLTPSDHAPVIAELEPAPA